MQTDLVEQAMRGNHDAFADLATRAWAKLYGTAGLILGDDGYAQEAVQAALIRAWRDLPTLRHPDRFDAWLTACWSMPAETRRGDGSAAVSARSGSTDCRPRLPTILWPGSPIATSWTEPSPG
jgi:hypothetical protein